MTSESVVDRPERAVGPGAAARRRRFADVPAGRMHLWLMVALTFTTGINDAVGYLGLDKVFTGNMTGNVVILGMALVGGTDLPVLGPALALVGFMVGAVLAGRSLRGVTAAWSPVTTVILVLVGTTMVGLGGALLLLGDAPGTGAMVTTTTLAATAMGAQAAAARHVGVKDVSTVVVTSTITGLAVDSRWGTRKPGGARRLSAVVAITLGATAGALALQVHLGVGLLAAGVLVLGITLVGDRHARLTRG
ncbi:YoaK family protein [Nocardioides sp. YIM 152588]|uniref:YoaK family protein n=1 Tax=Nocardioides sp. YIM 152588 TaxID=3158259 RepID=UPI0032E44197